MRIAIVDDEPSLIKLAKHTISDFGKNNNINIEFSEYPSGEDFLSEYSAGLFDIVFMDVFMPGISGIDTVLRLRETDPNVAVIFLTTSESHMKNALSCHAFDYLVKPAARTDFFKVLSECINMLGEKVFTSSRYIEFKNKGLNVKLPVSNLASIVANGHKITITTLDNIQYDTKERFSDVSEMLSDCDNILHINRGVLINMDNVDHFDDGNCYLKNGSCFAVKIKAVKAICQAYENYKFSKTV